MPIPIKPIPDNGREDNECRMDYSILANLGAPSPSAGKKTVQASNRDAEVLFNIWREAERIDEDKHVVKIDEKVALKDIYRLKAMGLISSEDNTTVSITKKGKFIISAMALSEQSSFLKDRKEKRYTEILAGMSKKDKTGYRIPKFASNNNCRLDVNDLRRDK